MSNDESVDSKDIDKVIHEPARLLIMTQLFVVQEADFIYLMRKTGLTWGHLSSHMTKLETAGYIDVEKTFVDKKPHTILKLTEQGRKAFRQYRKTLKQVLDQADI